METQREQEFVVAKVRGGAVEILGEVYRPTELRGKYDGEFEGEELVFSVYRDERGNLLKFCSLWGYEEQKKELDVFNRNLMGIFLWWNQV